MSCRKMMTGGGDNNCGILENLGLVVSVEEEEEFAPSIQRPWRSYPNSQGSESGSNDAPAVLVMEHIGGGRGSCGCVWLSGTHGTGNRK